MFNAEIIFNLSRFSQNFPRQHKKILFYEKCNEVNECQILSLNLEDEWTIQILELCLPCNLEICSFRILRWFHFQKTATFGDSLIMTDSKKKKTLRATRPFPFVMFLHPSNNVHGWDNGFALFFKETYQVSNQKNETSCL